MGTAKKTINQPDVLQLLTDQHAEVDELIEKLEEGDLDSNQKAATFRDLADRVAAHAAMEEKIFYPAIKAKETEDILRESVEEHLAVKRILADLLAMDVEDEQFDAKLSVMKEELEHHAHEAEEEVLFPKVRKMFDQEELLALGGECTALFEQLMASEPRNEVPAQVGKAARV